MTIKTIPISLTGPNAELIDPVRRIAASAAECILDIYQGDIDVSHKPDSTPVTEADFAADRLISAELARLTPEIPILSEEGEVPSFEERSAWRRYWLVDPLDGTREFINRNDEFTVNIALIEDGVAVLGVILVPVGGACYFAARGLGAYKAMPGEEPQPIRSRRWDGGHITLAGSRSHLSQRFHAFSEQFDSCEVLRLGSSLKSCYVAEGRADLYIRMGPTSEWDTAAAQPIVEEAGGSLTDTALKPLRYNTKDSLLNPHFMTLGDRDHDWQRYIL